VGEITLFANHESRITAPVQLGGAWELAWEGFYGKARILIPFSQLESVDRDTKIHSSLSLHVTSAELGKGDRNCSALLQLGLLLPKMRTGFTVSE
jgi:hypothetical protein